MRWIIFFTLLILFFTGCTSTDSGPAKTPVPTNESVNQTSKSYLKDIIFEDLGNNTTKITIVYLFPSTAYNATVVKVGAQNGSALIFVDVTKADTGLQVLTYRNLTVVVNQSISTAMVLTALPE